MRDKMNELKKEYESIVCSENLKERVDKTMKNKNKKWIYTIEGIAAALVICTVTLNAVPSLSAAAQDIPVVKNIVNVLTGGRFELKDGGYEADIETPEITGLENEELENLLNKEFRHNAEEIKNQFISDMEEIKKEYSGGEVHMGVSMGYKVKTNNDKILALDVYVVNTAGSSSDEHKYYTIDKKTEKLLTLDEIYKNTPDYKKILAEYIEKEMNHRNDEEEGLFFLPDDEFGGEDTKKALENINKFYINDSGKVVICFDKYEIAAGAQGSPEFKIPDDVLKADI